MQRYLGPYAEYVYALLRIVVGFFFACHGAQKVLGLFGGFGAPGATASGLLWFAGMIELVGGGLVCIGLFGSAAAFLCSGEMAFAYFMVHQPQGLFPIVNKGELAATYCFVFLLIAARGAGPLSVDASRGTR